MEKTLIYLVKLLHEPEADTLALYFMSSRPTSMPPSPRATSRNHLSKHYFFNTRQHIARRLISFNLCSRRSFVWRHCPGNLPLPSRELFPSSEALILFEGAISLPSQRKKKNIEEDVSLLFSSSKELFSFLFEEVELSCLSLSVMWLPPTLICLRKSARRLRTVSLFLLHSLEFWTKCFAATNLSL